MNKKKIPNETLQQFSATVANGNFMSTLDIP